MTATTGPGRTGGPAPAASPGGALVVVEYLVRVWRRSFVTTSAAAVGVPVEVVVVVCR